MQMRIETIRISGFRGFVKERVVDLSHPVTILYGDNARGKSSVLNAIEWCLFGSECAGKDTGMRERVGWKPGNRLGTEPCKVAMICQHPDGDIIFERTQVPKDRGLTISRKGQIIQSGAQANSWVGENIGDFTQFMAMVYQHQENIRHLAIAEDSFKRNIINRLLGLSDYANLLDSLQSTGYATLAGKVTKVRDDIDSTIDHMVFGYADLNKRLAKELHLKSTSISQKLIEAEATKLTKAVQDLYKKTGVTLSDRTSLDSYADPRKYLDRIRAVVRALQTTSPESKRNSEVGKQISDLDYYIARVAESAGKKSTEGKKLKEFEARYGKIRKLQRDLNRITEAKQSKEDEIARLDAMYSALYGLYKYLTENKLGIGKQVCIACGSTANNQQEFLKDRVQHLESDTIKAARDELSGICNEVESVTGHLAELQKLRQRLELADKAYMSEVREAVSKLKLSMDAGEDPLRVLNKNKRVLEQERCALQKNLAALLSEITRLEGSCDRLDKMATVTENKTRIEKLSSVRSHERYRELEKLESESAFLSSDIDAIAGAITLVRDTESKARVAGAKKTVRDYFNMIAENPGIKGLEMIVERSRNYENFRFIDASGDEVMTMLSQGDLNVLALSIFAGLGQANINEIPFQSIILDDPSQSMGSHHKEKLAELVNIIAANRQVIVGTMDSEFRDLLEKCITREVKVIEFARWDPKNGPTLR